MTIGSLFSGIGGLERGLEMLGLGPTLWQAENDERARRILRLRFPNAHLYSDVKEIDKKTKRVDVLCGGFPCQDISDAGTNHTRRGLTGNRSGLWSEFARIIAELRPPRVLIENVASLAERGLTKILSDLASCGYDAEWDCFTACSLGAPHTRNRLFILAYTDIDCQSARREYAQMAGVRATARALWHRRTPPTRTLGVANGAAGEMDRLHLAGNAAIPFVSALALTELTIRAIQ